jgi:hypothetical protein
VQLESAARLFETLFVARQGLDINRIPVCLTRFVTS